MNEKPTLKYGFAALILMLSPAGQGVFAQTGIQTIGPYKVVMEADHSLPNHTVYRPEQIGRVKGKMPVLAFGNGGCANAGNAFKEYLSEIASYGLLVVANGPINDAPLPPGRPAAPRPPGEGRGAAG